MKHANGAARFFFLVHFARRKARAREEGKLTRSGLFTSLVTVSSFF
jgi:hypothetical protein